MPLIRITADADAPRLFNATAGLNATLRRALAHPDTGSGPVVVMVHGYKYRPGHAVHCPHSAIFSLEPAPKLERNLSWPHHLGFGRGAADEGLAVAFSWQARGSIWQACRAALEAGKALAAVIADLHATDPTRKFHLLAHSLGARVALSALASSAPGAVNTVILLAGAEFTSTALDALASPGGQSARVLNVTSRENDLFDFLMERVVAPPRPGDQMLGLGHARAPNLVTLQLDAADTLAALRRAGFTIAEPHKRICHWSAYLRPGVFPLYRALLNDHLSFAQLRALTGTDPSPRWSRLLAQPKIALPLPFLAKAS
jgi:pimeloyl-ACP methyl ester carboxylesterase